MNTVQEKRDLLVTVDLHFSGSSGGDKQHGQEKYKQDLFNSSRGNKKEMNKNKEIGECIIKWSGQAFLKG